MSEVQQLPTTYNLQLLDDDHHLLTKESSQTEHNKNHYDILNLTQTKIDEDNIVQSLQRTEISVANKDKPTDDDLNTVNTTTMKTTERNLKLEEKLNQYNDLNIDGTLDLSSLNITDCGMSMIIEQAFHNEQKKCIRLILRDNTLTSIGVKILVDDLLIRPRIYLKNLGLSGNPDIGDIGIEYLINLLKTNRSIILLALHNTGITDQGVQLLSNLLCHNNNSLEKLYISFNKSITDASLEFLIQILEQNQTLKVLSLQHCSLSERARRKLRSIVTKKKKKKFRLSD